MTARGGLRKNVSIALVALMVLGGLLGGSPAAFAAEATPPGSAAAQDGAGASSSGEAETPDAEGTRPDAEGVTPVDEPASADPAEPRPAPSPSPKPKPKPAERPSASGSQPADAAGEADAAKRQTKPAESVAPKARTAVRAAAAPANTSNPTPCSAPAPGDGETAFSTGASLDWGVRSAFRSYVTGPIAHGTIDLLGTTTGAYRWVDGGGSVSGDGAAGHAGFGAGNGVHFQGHPMQGEYALDMNFTNPCIEIVSPQSAQLYLDVEGREFKSMTELGEKVSRLGVHFADLELGSPAVADGASLWSDAEAVLTEDGAAAFGGFYPAGTELDPVTFSLPVEVAPKTPTSTSLTVSSASIVEGRSVVLTSTTTPAVDGTVTFSDGAKTLGSPVAATGGIATLRAASLAAGDHELRAAFTPSDPAYASSRSAKATVRVTEPSTASPVGVLQWGVKKSFRNYVVGPIAHGKITVRKPATQNAAKSVYSFPQIAGGNYDPKAGTGSVRYAGIVNFSGHEGAMDVNLLNPVIRVSSASKATLQIVHEGKTLTLANIDLASAQKTRLSGSAMRYSGATTTLSKDGASKFFVNDTGEGPAGTFYSAGEELDPVTFVVGQNSGATAPKPPAKKPSSSKKTGEGEKKPQAAAKGETAGSLSWGISAPFVAYTTCAGKERYGYSHCAKGTITTDGVGDGYLFPQAEGGDWDAKSQTGSVQYSGVVTFSGYGMTMFRVANPRITVDGPNSATIATGNDTKFGAASYRLDLGAGTKTVGDNGEVTWSGVPVQGSLSGGAGGSSDHSIGLDSLTFTVGAASSASFGSTAVDGGSKADKKANTAGKLKTGLSGATAPGGGTSTGVDGAQEVQAAGFTATGGSSDVELWVTALSLVVIAGCMTALTVVQRRRGSLF